MCNLIPKSKGECSPGGLTLSYCTTVTSWISGYISGAENVHSFITQILPAGSQFQKIHIPYFSAVGFDPNIFSQIRHFHEIMQLPTLRNPIFVRTLTVCWCMQLTQNSMTRIYCVLLRVNAVQSRYGDHRYRIKIIRSAARTYAGSGMGPPLAYLPCSFYVRCRQHATCCRQHLTFSASKPTSCVHFMCVAFRT